MSKTKPDSEDMSVRAIWNIRDARGLNQDEKAFLFVVASRGVMYSEWQKAAEDMGMKKTRYFKTRKGLIDKGLIEEGRRMDDTTVYRVKEDILATYVPAKKEAATSITWAESHIETGHSVYGNDHAVSGTDHSGGPETKVTMKETKKVTVKETDKEAALRAAEAQGELSNTKEEKVEIDEVVDSSFAMNSNEAGSSLESEVVGSALDVEEEGSAAAASDDRELIEEILSNCLDEEKARRLFNDETWSPKYQGITRARWAETCVIPEPVNTKTAFEQEAW